MATSSASARTWLAADQAAALLGVTKATLYAYVSRGKLSAAPGRAHNESLYRRSELEALVRQRGRARRPREVARAALTWGLPVLESKLTLIADQRLFYRGIPVRELAAHASLEDAACLLWQAEPAEAFGAVPPALPAVLRHALQELAALPCADRVLAAFALLQARHTAPGGLADARALFRHAGALLRLSCAAALGTSASSAPIHRQFEAAWQLPPRATEAVRAALVLSADHELNASGFVARCVASTGADPGKAVVAGLAALSGGLHGGMTARVETMWDELGRGGGLRRGLGERLARGERVAGFGHPLYPDGDPRAAEILARLPAGPVKARALRVAAEVEALTGRRPSLDFALVGLRRAIGAPDGSAYAIFAVARTVGWIAHAIEQRADGELIRPRAAYTGVAPATQPALEPGTPARPASVFAR